MNRFVLVVPFAPAETQAAVNGLIASQGWGWLHWGNDTWLIVTAQQSNAAIMREQVQKFAPGIQFFVVAAETAQSPQWACYGPHSWGEWFRNAWESPPRSLPYFRQLPKPPK